MRIGNVLMSYSCASFDYPGLLTRNLCFSGYHVAKSHQLPCLILFFVIFFKWFVNSSPSEGSMSPKQVRGVCTCGWRFAQKWLQGYGIGA